MSDLTPEQKISAALNDKFHASIINDAGIRKAFIDVMTCYSIPGLPGNLQRLDDDVTDAEMDSAYRFIIAVDYMLATLGYGIFDMDAEGGPVHFTETHTTD